MRIDGRPGPKGNVRRNRRMLQRYREGLGMVRLSRRFKVCPKRAWVIVKREVERAG